MPMITTRQPSELRIAELKAWLSQVDPELLEAAEEVDRSLLQWMLTLSPLQRLEAASKAARGLAGFHHAPSRTS